MKLKEINLLDTHGQENTAGVELAEEGDGEGQEGDGDSEEADD